MTNKEAIEREIIEAEKDFLKYQDRLVKHLKIAHSGYLATTCHECLQCQQGIQSNERFIEEAKAELKIS